MSDLNKEIEDKIKMAGAIGISAAIEELARKLFQGDKPHRSPSSNTPSSPSAAWSHTAPSYPSSSNGYTMGEVFVSPREASSGTFRYFLLHWYEEIVAIPAGVKDGQTLYFRCQGGPTNPGDRSKLGRKDLYVRVRVQ